MYNIMYKQGKQAGGGVTWQRKGRDAIALESIARNHNNILPYHHHTNGPCISTPLTAQ